MMENTKEDSSRKESRVEVVMSGVVEKNNASMKLLNDAGTKVKLEIQTTMSGLHDALRIRELSLMNQVDHIVQAEQAVLISKHAKLCETIGRMNINKDDDDNNDDDHSDDNDSSSDDDNDDVIKISSADLALRPNLELRVVGNQGELRKRILNFGKVVPAKKRNESFEVISKDNSEFYSDLMADINENNDDDAINDDDDDDDDDDDVTSSSSSSSSSQGNVQSKKELKKNLKKVLRANRHEALQSKIAAQQSDDKNEFLKKWLKSLNDIIVTTATTTTGDGLDRTGVAQGDVGGSAGVFNPLRSFIERLSQKPMDYWLGGRCAENNETKQQQRQNNDININNTKLNWEPFKFQMNNNNNNIIINNDDDDDNDDKINNKINDDKFLFNWQKKISPEKHLKRGEENDNDTTFAPFRFNFEREDERQKQMLRKNDDNDDDDDDGADTPRKHDFIIISSDNGDNNLRNVDDDNNNVVNNVVNNVANIQQQQRATFTPFSFKPNAHPLSRKYFKLEQKLMNKWLKHPSQHIHYHDDNNDETSLQSTPPPSSSSSSSAAAAEKNINDALSKMKELYESPIEMWLR